MFPFRESVFREGLRRKCPCVSVSVSVSVSEVMKYYILLTEHLSTILVNNQLDALLTKYLFISHLYMFRAIQCWYAGRAYQTVTYTD